MNDYSYIAANLAQVRERMAAAAARVGVPVPRLLPVTKYATMDEVRALLALGIDEIGENYAQQARDRMRLLSEEGIPVSLHFIGSLQRNKVKYIIGQTKLLHSLDSLTLAEELDRQAGQRGIVLPVLLEINSGRESAKGGALPEDAERMLGYIARLPHLSVQGLMTMGPALPDAEALRPCFRETKTLLDRLAASHCFSVQHPILSMGMSDSFEVAIEEGADIVRVGHRLFAREA